MRAEFGWGLLGSRRRRESGRGGAARFFRGGEWMALAYLSITQGAKADHNSPCARGEERANYQ